MWATRSHYRDTWFDQRSDIGAAPFHSELRMRPNEWKVDNKTYVNERNGDYSPISQSLTTVYTHTHTLTLSLSLALVVMM